MKFNVALLIAFAAGFVMAGVLMRWIVIDHARGEVLQRARIMMASAQAIRDYTSQDIGPKLAPQNETRFLPETVPSFAAQLNFRTLETRFPEYRYKEAALNPTNPNDRAADWEADIINEFRNRSDVEELVAERDTPTGRSLTLSRPIAIKDPACLVCHSTPAAAPPTLINAYGSANGFGWQLNDVIGAQVVSVPMAVPLAQADRTFWIFLGVLICVFMAVFVILNALLQTMVIRPVVRMSGIAEAVSLGDLDVPEYEKRGHDEISSLSRSFNRMRRSLETAMKLLA